MIAETRPQSYKSPLEESEMDLFAGLSFPTVPTSSIILTKAPLENVAAFNVTKAVDKSVVETDAQIIDDVDVETTQLLPTEEKTSTKRGNLSTLYATEIIVSEVSAYPDLPSLGHNSPARTSHNISNHKEQYEEEHSESSSLLGNGVSESNSRNSLSAPSVFVQNNVRVQHQHSIEQQQPTQQQQPEDTTLVTDLIRENTRLADELANLRGIAQLQNGGGMKSAPLANTADKRAASSDGVTGLVTSSSAPATGIKISDTSMPPKQGVKYVCCGGCRQWLLAPRDAVYVACGSCQAVNNCNLVSNKARSNADAETRALQQPAPVRRTLPWFLDCFGGPPADA